MLFFLRSHNSWEPKKNINAAVINEYEQSMNHDHPKKEEIIKKIIKTKQTKKASAKSKRLNRVQVGRKKRDADTKPKSTKRGKK